MDLKFNFYYLDGNEYKFGINTNSTLKNKAAQFREEAKYEVC